MQKRIPQYLAALAISLALSSATAAAQGVEPLQPNLPVDPGYAAYAAPAGTTGQLVSMNAAAADADLAGRVADLEEQLSKIKAKEAADKKKAAEKPTVSAGGRIMWDNAVFSQGAASRDVYGDIRNGSEFRRARIFVKGDAFHVVDYKI